MLKMFSKYNSRYKNILAFNYMFFLFFLNLNVLLHEHLYTRTILEYFIRYLTLGCTHRVMQS